jgi:hypothetical protein
MADVKTPERQVRFRVTRPNTSIFHPDRSVSSFPVETGGEIDLPVSVADYHVKNGVGEIVTDEATEEPTEPPATEPPAAKRVGRPPNKPTA